jgi:hypothetical protein
MFDQIDPNDECCLVTADIVLWTGDDVRPQQTGWQPTEKVVCG